MANQIKGIESGTVAIVAGLVIIVAAGSIAIYTGTIGLGAGALATVGAVVTGAGVYDKIKGTKIK